MTQDSSPEKLVDKLIGAATSPRDKAFVAVLGRGGITVSEAIELKEIDIDFQRASLTIVRFREQIKLKCPDCGEPLGKRGHVFCGSCGNRIGQPLRERVERRWQRAVAFDSETLRLLQEYLTWRRQFPYSGPLAFPFSRQRGWQLLQRISRRAGMVGLHPRSLYEEAPATPRPCQNSCHDGERAALSNCRKLRGSKKNDERAG